MNTMQLIDLQQEVKKVFVAGALLDYVQAILRHSRESAKFVHGLSPRAGLSLLAAARAWALIDGRKAVIPEDIQAVLPSVASHRLQSIQPTTGANLMQEFIEAVAIP